MKKFTAIFLICQIVFLLAFPALASLATPADADILEEFELATSSDAVSILDSLMQYSNISLMASGEVEEVQTTIAQPTNIKVVYRYRDKNSKQHEISTYLNSKGYFSFNTPPSDLGSSYELLFWFTDTKPPSGKYLMKFSLSSDTGGHSFSSATLWSQKLYSNSSSLTDGKGIPITQYSGDVSGSATVDIGSVGPICINLRVQDLIPPCGGYFNLRFERLKDQSVSTDITTVGGSYSSGDATADTAQSSAQIAQNTADMNDTLKEIVQTISNQLAALWDQMYNLMHLPQLANDDKNTDRIINKLGQDLNVEIQNDTAIKDEIIENNNENTETIVNGYDNSGMNSDNDRLSDKLTEYDSKENEVIGQVSDKLDGFEFGTDLSAYASIFSLFGYFLTGFYNGLGVLNVPVAFSLTLMIALTFIGYYRFKGGA